MAPRGRVVVPVGSTAAGSPPVGVAAMTITTILLIPPEGSTLLTKSNDTGCRPPVLDWLPECDRFAGRWTSGWRLGPSANRALVLARDGKVQRHGCLTLAENGGAGFNWATDAAAWVRAALGGEPQQLERVLGYNWPGARLVFLDADGREVQP